MSAIIKAFLLLAIVTCISKTQMNEPGQNFCLMEPLENKMLHFKEPSNNEEQMIEPSINEEKKIEHSVNERRTNCLCQRIRNNIISKVDIKDIQIYHATVFCSKVEIVVTNKYGYCYCLNPELKTIKIILSGIKKKTSTSKPTGVTSTTSSNPSTSI